jgi:phosphate-selective porin OprO/OprP
MKSRTHGTLTRTARFLAALAATASIVAGAQASTGEEEKRVNQEVLDILLEKGDIDQQRYDELSAREAAEHKAATEDKVDVFYKNALNIQGDEWKIKIGGRIQADFATIHVQDKLGNAFDDESDPADASMLKGDGEGVEFRRARLYMSGELYDRILFKSQFDFAGGSVALKDVYIGMKGLGFLGTVKVGHFKEPFSLEEMASSKYLTFMERSLASVFDSVRNLGIGFENHYLDERMTAAGGIFAPTDDGGKFFSNDTDFDLTGRITGLPFYDEDDGDLLHLGFSIIQMVQDDITNSFSQRPEVHLAKKYLFTGDWVGDGATILNPEIAMVFGSAHASFEWKQIFADRNDGKDWEGMGAYVQSGVFLTGETRPYNTRNGTFARVTPNKPFDPVRGDWGAWELAARFSFLDLNDSGMKGGKEYNVTAGLNWYLYPSLRLMFNYVFADIDDTGVSPAFGTRGGGNLHAFQMRAALEF